MPSLKSDIVGHVARLPLKPSEANSLLPLYEAVSNSLHALTERYGDKGATSKGRIEIEVLRDDTQGEIFPVCGFVVRDNGAGFNDTNYTSFLTPFSQLKMARGGKGIGRLGWLKVFEHIHVESHYETNEGLKVRDFDFVLTEKEQIAIRKEGAAESGEVGTTLTLSGYQSSYGSYCPDKVTTIIQRLIGHFLPVFAGDNANALETYGPAPASVTGEGRFNHAAAPMLYLANDESIAAAELNAAGEDCLVAQLRILIPLKILDLIGANGEPVDEELFNALANSALLAAPRTDVGWIKRQYVFSRFVADCARSAGFDAIRYGSTKLHTGVNYAVLVPPADLSAFLRLEAYSRLTGPAPGRRY